MLYFLKIVNVYDSPHRERESKDLEDLAINVVKKYVQ